ncbi:MAG: alpha/beta fold hydrolase [Gammaproteobacteria bacterium]
MPSLSTATYGHGKPLILLHGWGFSKQIWAPLLPKLTPTFQVTVVDLPGHGQSPLLPHVQAIEQVVEHLVHHTPADGIWLGWSLGGILSLAVVCLSR